jgi:succinate dehydrogenase/fumarate reductase-like Fe-S protein
MSRPITIEIERYDPDSGETWRQQYQVPLEAGWSVLNVLNWIYENTDPTLAFYYSCRIGKCEGCEMMMNGNKILACNTLVEGDIVLEPMPEFQVFKDLIPNRSRPRVAVGGRGRVRV